MRETVDGKGLVQYKGNTMGVGLGVGYCAEHGRGIRGIQKAFGIPQEGIFGFEARRISQLPPNLHCGEHQDGVYIAFDPDLSRVVWGNAADGRLFRRKPTPEDTQRRLEQIIERQLVISDTDKTQMAAAWDEESFAVYGKKGMYGEIMEALYEAFLTGDAVIDGRSDFASGFSLLVYSRIPEVEKEKFRKIDEEKRRETE